jgi:hypothetical protein
MTNLSSLGDYMAGLLDIVYGLTQTSPSEGGLLSMDYPNPYGLRAYPKKNKKGEITGYGGEMLPKSVGWLGLIPGKGEMKGETVTEYSLDDEKGSFPSVVPTLDAYERDNVAKGTVTQDMIKKAMEWRDLMQSQGLSPFYNSFDR